MSLGYHYQHTEHFSYYCTVFASCLITSGFIVISHFLIISNGKSLTVKHKSCGLNQTADHFKNTLCLPGSLHDDNPPYNVTICTNMNGLGEVFRWENRGDMLSRSRALSTKLLWHGGKVVVFIIMVPAYLDHAWNVVSQ